MTCPQIGLQHNHCTMSYEIYHAIELFQTFSADSCLEINLSLSPLVVVWNNWLMIDLVFKFPHICVLGDILVVFLRFVFFLLLILLYYSFSRATLSVTSLELPFSLETNQINRVSFVL